MVPCLALNSVWARHGGRVRSRLWVGSRNLAEAAEVLESVSIRYVLNVRKSGLVRRSDRVQYEDVSVGDHADSDLLSRLPDALDALDAAIRDLSAQEEAKDSQEEEDPRGAVLVACNAGVSRSATVVAAWLMRTEGLSVEHAIMSVREARPIVNPRLSFIEQLRVFQRMNYCITCPQGSYLPLFRLHWLRLFVLLHLKRADPKRRSQEGVVFGGFFPEPNEPEQRGNRRNFVGGDLPFTQEFYHHILYKDPSPDQEQAYGCAYCKRALVPVEAIVEHVDVVRPTAFNMETGDPAWVDEGRRCALEEHMYHSLPVAWMLGRAAKRWEGSLRCPSPSCDKKIGDFSWRLGKCQRRGHPAQGCRRDAFPLFRFYKERFLPLFKA